MHYLFRSLVSLVCARKIHSYVYYYYLLMHIIFIYNIYSCLMWNAPGFQPQKINVPICIKCFDVIDILYATAGLHFKNYGALKRKRVYYQIPVFYEKLHSMCWQEIALLSVYLSEDRIIWKFNFRPVTKESEGV